MKRLLMAFAVMALILGPVRTVVAATTATASVTIDVQAIDEISVSANPGTLTINATTASVAAGASSFTVTDTGTNYSVTTNSAVNKKITAHLDSAITQTGLQLFVTLASTSGVSSGETEVTSVVAAAPTTVVTGLLQEADSAQTITYKATATVATPIGSVTKTITLTVINQV